ncbi:FHIPEP family type III secretion protein [Pseudoroseomonas wenyumeiae]
MGFLARLRRAIGHQDLLFAAAMVLLLAVLVLPMPSWLVDLGLATSITLSVLILMVAIWIERPGFLLPFRAAGGDAATPGAEPRHHAADPGQWP